MAGVPFEWVTRLATPATAAAARQVLVRRTEFARAKAEVEQILPKQNPRLSEGLFRAWRKAIDQGTVPPSGDAPSQAFVVCWKCASDLAMAEANLSRVLEQELEAARKGLAEFSQTVLPSYLVFVGKDLRERLLRQATYKGGVIPPRKKEQRAHERHMLLYLQRLCAKNDSLSEFGPEGWGTIGGEPRHITLSPQLGIAQRETFLERWTAHGIAAAINSDPETRIDLCPRLHPNGRIEKNEFIFTDTGEMTSLDPKTIQTLLCCDGVTPAYLFDDQIGTLEQLAAEKMIVWELEVPALDPHAFDVLFSDVRCWRDNAIRTKWLALLESIAELPSKFATTDQVALRAAIMDDARRKLEQLGTARNVSDRFLYSATNPIGEECFRECNFSIGEELINEVTVDAAPWIDLWRDTYAFVASRVAAGLRALVEKAPLRDGSLPLPA